jgi:hypothetical protein
VTSNTVDHSYGDSGHLSRSPCDGPTRPDHELGAQHIFAISAQFPGRFRSAVMHPGGVV